MALTNDIIIQEMVRRKFPNILTDDDWQSIIDASVREFDRTMPVTMFVTFTTQINVTDYYIFDPTDPQTQIPDPANPGQFIALCANALDVTNTYWNPGGDWSSLNIFSPGWQMLSQMILYTGSYFHQPSQMLMLRQKLGEWQTQFGNQGFDVYGEPGQPQSFLRIYPEPQDSQGQVIVEFTRGHALTDIGLSYTNNFYMWVQYHLAEALTNYYANTAGVQLLGFTDSVQAMKYWERRMDFFWKRIEAKQNGAQGWADRS